MSQGPAVVTVKCPGCGKYEKVDPAAGQPFCKTDGMPMYVVKVEGRSR